MTNVLDPLQAADRIAGDYTRYLRSAFLPSDPELRRDFEGQLSDGKQLTKGPILQAQAPYTLGRSLRSLVDEGLLHPRLLAHDDLDGLDLDRPLYTHQEQAIRRAAERRNLIVATGTGSGKTESFLLPILNDLLAEYDSGTLGLPGVRAMLLYPMNALANDQLLRLRELLAPFPEITFGRYVGDTPHTLQEGMDQYRHRFDGATPLPNELVARDQMKSSPPHVLVTNFAMLEYLLLRPDDQAIFDGATGEHWKFVVLDEIHVYDGAKGAEIGMLLRRVRDRVHRSQRGRLSYIGTSATLGRGAEDLPRLVEFGRQLFDEVFEPQDVVEAVRDELVQADATWFCDEDALLGLRDAFRSGAPATDLHRFVAASGAAAPVPDESASEWLGRTFVSEGHVCALQQLLVSGSVDLAEVAGRVMKSAAKARELTALVDLCVGAEGETGRSLVPARWHFLLRALEGAFTCLHPDHPNAEPRVLLSRHRVCPGCASQRRESAMFECAVCRRCGARYVVGEDQPVEGVSRLVPPRPFAEQPRSFLVLGAASSPDEVLDDEDDEAAEGGPADRFDPAVVCSQCGALGKRRLSCGCGAPAIALREVKPTAPDRPVRHCAACGGRTSGGSIVQRFLTGSDAPVAVIATSLYQELPTAPSTSRIGGGRKLLSFADSRQDAAFFAPYLERTYNRAVQRRLLWQVMTDLAEDGEEAFRIRELVPELANRALLLGVLDEADERQSPKAHARSWIYGEFIGSDTRQSLEGVGLAEIAVPMSPSLSSPAELTDLGLSHGEALDLVQVMLLATRRARAVTVSTDIDLDDPIFEGRPMTGLRGDQSTTRVLSWNPSRGTNQRVRYMAKVLESLGADPSMAPNLVRAVWEWLMLPGVLDEQLVSEEAAFAKGIVYRLNAKQLEFRPLTDAHRPSRCALCRQVWWRTVRGLCPSIGCAGTVEEFDPLGERNHYRELYTSLTPIGMRVEEHTAQLSNELAAKRQQDFIKGKVNALSCSTTFELGVDVGAIQAVLMRNVPPTAANYVQRAGRAGRRAGSPALVVTFAQRRSHDLQFFEHPNAMIDGHVAAPVVKLENAAIVRRHLNAMAFAEFEKLHYDGRERPHRTVERFFLPSGDSPADHFIEWLRSGPPTIGAASARVVPEGLRDHADIAIERWGWLDGLDGDPSIEGRGRMEIAAREVRRELAVLDGAIDEAFDERRAARAAHLQRVRSSIATVQTLDRLARVGVLPKYGFPVDVVSLDLGAESSVAIDRDLSQAVAEFAPGNQIVADKRLWEPVGLKVQDNLPLPVHRSATCSNPECGARWTWLDEIEEPPSCPGCDAPAPGVGDRLIQPRFGFIGQESDRKPGDQRPPKRAFASSFFDDYVGSRPDWRHVAIGSALARVARSRNGRITVVNAGPGGGYQVCRWCGFIREASGEVLAEHDRPRSFGAGKGASKCAGSLVRTQLGHWYLTDTVQIDPGAVYPHDHLLSLAAALVAGIDAVGIAQADVLSSVSPHGAGYGTIVLYDSVPGGAGHAHRVADLLPQLFSAARRRVEECDCGEETSCYGCLRSYRNQRDHELLERRLALTVLTAMGVN